MTLQLHEIIKQLPEYVSTKTLLLLVLRDLGDFANLLEKISLQWWNIWKYFNNHFRIYFYVTSLVSYNNLSRKSIDWRTRNGFPEWINPLKDELFKKLLPSLYYFQEPKSFRVNECHEMFWELNQPDF